jgi:hypothetical protein
MRSHCPDAGGRETGSAQPPCTPPSRSGVEDTRFRLKFAAIGRPCGKVASRKHRSSQPSILGGAVLGAIGPTSEVGNPMAALQKISMILISICVLGSLCCAETVGSREERWCLVNQTAEVYPNDMLRLPAEKLHVVEESRQASARIYLNSRTFSRISKKGAGAFLKPGESLSDGGLFYLAKAGGFRIDSHFGTPPTPPNIPSIAAYFSRSHGTLRIVEYSFSPRGAEPTNFVILVETEAPVLDFHSECATAE